MRSDRIKVGFERAPHRSLLKATGVTDEDMRKPFIAVVNSYIDIIPGHVHLQKFGQVVKEAIREAGRATLGQGENASGLSLKLTGAPVKQLEIRNAVERDRLEAAGHDWARLAAEHDDVVPVTEFALPATRARAILELFPDLSVVAAPLNSLPSMGRHLVAELCDMWAFALAAWFLFGHSRSSTHDPDAVPRAITPRGDLVYFGVADEEDEGQPRWGFIEAAQEGPECRRRGAGDIGIEIEVCWNALAPLPGHQRFNRRAELRGRDHGQAAARLHRADRRLDKALQLTELVVDRDSQGLEGPRRRMDPAAARRHDPAHHAAQLAGCPQRSALAARDDRPRHRPGPALLTEVAEDLHQLLQVDPGEEVWLVGSTTGLGNGPCFNQIGGLCMDIQAPA